MKIIFLDVDGVLNSEQWFIKTDGLSGYWDIDYSKVNLLKQIVDATGAKIVLSSTWRHFKKEFRGEEDHPMYKYLVDSLAQFGLEIMDCVPYAPDPYRFYRPKEISMWLNSVGYEIEMFVSLDDDFDYGHYALYGLDHCLIRTSFYGNDGGLTPKHVEKAIEILNKNERGGSDE